MNKALKFKKDYSCQFPRVKQKACRFTLIELLIVIAIIGVLVTLLMPALSRARQMSLQAVCMSKNQQLFLAMSTFAKGNNGKYTLAYQDNKIWTAYLIAEGYWGGKQTVSSENLSAYYGCPNRPDGVRHDSVSYSLNYYIAGWVDRPVVPIAKFSNPSELFSFVETQWDGDPETHGWLNIYLNMIPNWNYSGHNKKRGVVTHADGHVTGYGVGYMDQSKSTPDKHWFP